MGGFYMAEINCTPLGFCSDTSFKEAVCISAGRIFDSCSDKDCIEDLQVNFASDAQSVIDNAINVKTRNIEVLNVYMDIEPVPFNKGFYSVDMTFFFNVALDVFTCPASCPTCVEGLAVFNKKVILYGSEGSVKVFSSDQSCLADDSSAPNNHPKASVQVVDPISLSTRLCECKHHKYEPLISVPNSIACRYSGEFNHCEPCKTVLITMGLFSIVQLERSVQMMVPVYDYCVPDKECVSTSDNPCDLFKKIKFPVNEFFPPRLSDMDDESAGKCCE